MTSTTALRWLLAGGLLFLPAAIRAQHVARVSILNTTDQGGGTVADVVIPVPRGLLRAAPPLQTDRQEACQVTATGARWRDGSLRYLKVELPVEVQPREAREVKLFVRTGPEPAFRPHPAVAIALPGVRLFFRAANRRVAFGAPELVETGSRVWVYRCRARVPDSCIWAQVHLLVMHQVPNVRFDLQWGNSNPQRPDLHEDPGEVAFEFFGADFQVDEHDAKVLAEYDVTGGGRGIVLHRGGWMADGQAQSFEGRIPVRGEAPRVRALARGWAESFAFGPTGELFPECPVAEAWWRALVDHEANRQARIPWAAPVHGCNPNPGNAGDQSDFGAIVMRPDVLTADPARLAAIARSVQQEWCRPTHYREVDGSPVRTANHPHLVTRDGRPHWRAGPQIDLLGKPAEYLDDSKIAFDEQHRTYRGHDAQHLSINYLCAFALTTGDRIALRECEHYAEMWLSEFTHDSGTLNDHPGAARAVGRELAAGCWLYLVTGRDDLKVRIAQRVHSVLMHYLQPRTGESALLPWVLVPRWDSTRGNYWPPWEESIAVVGLAAVHALFDNVEAAWVALQISDNVVRHGVGVTPYGWRVGYKVPFSLVPNFPYLALLDPRFNAEQAAGGGLTMWTMPAIRVAAHFSADPLARVLGRRMWIDLVSQPGAVDNRLFEWIAILPAHLEGR